MKLIRYSLIALLTISCSPMEDDTELPNIVLLIGDDHGYPYFGFMGDEQVVTPTMDALAEGGVTFSQGMVTTPYCRPSLRTMATGMHPVQYQRALNAHIEQRIAEDDSYARLDARERRMWTQVEKARGLRSFDTLPGLLKRKGYVSWQGGKWWEGSHENGHFDEGMSVDWDMSLFGTDKFFYQMMGGTGNDLVRKTMEPLFEFIDKSEGSPMFIWFAPSLPHYPFDAPEEFMALYEKQDISESAKFYYANISWWDQGVKELMEYMQAKGLADNTLFIYLSDNGWEQDPDVEYWSPEAVAKQSPEWHTGGYSGKGALHDLSLRTPVIFHWQGRFDSTFNDSALVSSMDLVPTILDIVGLPAPDHLLGTSLLPMIKGGGGDPERYLVSYSDNRRSPTDMMGQPADGYAVRTLDWHFLWYSDTGEMQLYDVRKDPRGKVNLARKRQDVVETMMERIRQFRQEYDITGRFAIHE